MVYYFGLDGACRSSFEKKPLASFFSIMPECFCKSMTQNGTRLPDRSLSYIHDARMFATVFFVAEEGDLS